LENRLWPFSRAGAKFEEAEYDQLFLDLYPRMFSVAYRILGDPDDAEDLAIEAFWKLWVNPPLRKDNVSGWLYRTVTNLGYNQLRSNRRRASNEGQATENIISASIEEEIERSEIAAHIRAILRKLPRRDAQILILRSSGISYAEIAVTLGIAPNSVGALLARAERKYELLFQAGEKHAPE
jgi:RNA polymerase sigma-70 factor (ECF subfamily)